MSRYVLISVLAAWLVLAVAGCDADQNTVEGASGLPNGAGETTVLPGDDSYGSAYPGRVGDIDQQLRPGDSGRITPDHPPVDDDTADDDTTPPIPDQEYPSLLCTLPDPEGLGSGIMFGGLFEGTITVYVYDDETCLPIQNAEVKFQYPGVLTNYDGKAVLTGVPAGALITANKNEYWVAGYQADAAVMYFRLHPNYYYVFEDYTDTAPGHFTAGDQPLALTAPQSLEEALLNPIYLGFGSPGIARAAALSAGKYLTADADFEVHFVNPYETIDLTIWTNFYVPDTSVVFDVPGYGPLGFYGAHEEYQVPVHAGTTEMALQGAIAGLNAGQVVDESALLEVINAILDGGDFIDIILPFFKPLVNDALAFPYVGARPSWLLDGSPDVPVYGLDSGKKHVKVDIANPNPDFDYAEMLWAEIPNRALLPMGLKIWDGKTVKLPYAVIPDADYLALSIKTDLLTSEVYSSRLSIAAQYAEDLTEWKGGLTFDDADFLPPFDPTLTQYDYQTGQLTWELEGSGADRVDMFWLAFMPWWYQDPEMIMLTLPKEARSLNLAQLFPSMSFDYYDTIFLLAVDLPFDYDDGFDPSRLFGYNLPAFSMWVYPDPAELIRGLW